MVFNKVIKHFDGILFWEATVIRMTAMIKLRHQQPSLWHRGLAEDMEGLWEPWMLLVDKLLEDEQLLDTVYEAQGDHIRATSASEAPVTIWTASTGTRCISAMASRRLSAPAGRP